MKMIKYFASFFLVSLTSGKSVRGILNSMLKYSNTFSSPLSNSFFFPVDNMVLVSVDKFAHHPSQRSASVSSDRRQGLHGPDRDHRKGVYFRRLYFLTKKIGHILLVTFTNLCRSSPLDKIIHLPHC